MDGNISQNKDDIGHLLDMLSYELAPFYNINRKCPELSNQQRPNTTKLSF